MANLKFKVTMEKEWGNGEIVTKDVEFEDAGELEQWLAYNRAYIKGLVTVEGDNE